MHSLSNGNNSSAAGENLRHYGRNLLWLSVVEAGWGIGCAFLSPGAVLPMLAASLGAGMGLVGLLPGLACLATTLPQLAAVHRTSGMGRQLGWVARWHVVPTLAFLPIAALAASGGTGAWQVALLYLALTLWHLGVGTVMPVWMAFVGKLSGAGRRGRTFGVISTVNLLAGAAGAWLAGRLLVALPGNLGYAAGALAAFAVVNLGNLAWLGIREESASGEREAESASNLSLSEYLRKLAGSVKTNPAFGKFLVTQQMLSLHTILGSFYLLQARERLGVSEEVVLGWSSLTLVAQAAGSLLYGAAGDRLGARGSLVVSQVLLAAATLTMLSASSEASVSAVSVLLGLFYGTYFNARQAMIMQMAPGGESAAYLALASTASTPAAVLVPAVSGVAIEWVGYGPVLLVTLAGALVASLSVALGGGVVSAARRLGARGGRTVASALFWTELRTRRVRLAFGLW